MHNVHEKNCLEAWKTVVALLLQHEDRRVFNLVVEITAATVYESNWLRSYSPHKVAGRENILDVIDTIFPISLASRFPDRSALYREYLVRHDRAMKWRRNQGRWGTYFQRLIRFGHTNPVNQLELAIEKLINWPTRNTTGLVFHLSSPALDRPRTRGGPCWHFGEILWREDNILDLVAVYRNHDFFDKALGNYLALGQLLGFIAQATGKTPGRLIVHSVQAFSSRSATDLKMLAN